MMTDDIETKIRINVKYPRDDYYLQWGEIYWWQLKFEIQKRLEQCITE